MKNYEELVFEDLDDELYYLELVDEVTDYYYNLLLS
jgi:hypothetical protein